MFFWGKIVGACLGFLVLGPAGALLGVFIGNIFDKGLSNHITRPHQPYHQEKRVAVRLAFQHALFSLMGHIAKSDGRVNESEIAHANGIMRELRFSYRERQKAMQAFNAGKKAAFNYHEPLKSFLMLSKDNHKLQMAFVQIIYRFAQAGGLSNNKIAIVNGMLRAFNLAPLHEQAHAQGNFYQHFHHQQRQQKSYQYQQHEQRAEPNTSFYEPDAYRILKVSAGASKQEVKRAYRKLISEYHPDKQIAKGASEATIQAANEKTQTIRKAYESICESRGW